MFLFSCFQVYSLTYLSFVLAREHRGCVSDGHRYSKKDSASFRQALPFSGALAPTFSIPESQQLSPIGVRWQEASPVAELTHLTSVAP